ncbi:glycosyltransferase family 2 protein [Mycobacterium sp. 236(2023)]|uniref:glycosyltransferase family 2 protein n=1 Tax=Mycobacterium sp. 236(2023) TaxID=3038163 RepID=UPI0024155EFF|nr:glycosyltransferase family 2 protein [Mycobacterium sp. 236(2023)]MDG4667532.1 glycosyltransferase family 2 protein [Mycobacterium sp. 236(2023)]
MILPAFCAAPFLPRAVRSVMDQTHDDWELIVVADDDTDYATVLAACGIDDPRIHFASTGRLGAGPGTARNVGLDASRTSLVVTLDADDTLDPRSLERILPHAAVHGAAYSDIRIISDDTGEPLINLDRPIAAGLVALEEILTSRIHTYAFTAFDRTKVRARWPEGRVGWEDVWFCAACFDDLDAIYHLDEPCYVYRRRSGSTSTQSGAADYFLQSARELRRRLETVAAPDIRSSATRVTLVQYLRGREHLEARFLDEEAAGRAHKFLDFVADHRDQFYRLDPEVPVP